MWQAIVSGAVVRQVLHVPFKVRQARGERSRSVEL